MFGERWSTATCSTRIFAVACFAGKLVNQEISVWFANPIKSNCVGGISNFFSFFPCSKRRSTFESVKVEKDEKRWYSMGITIKQKKIEKQRRKKNTKARKKTRCNETKRAKNELKSNYVLWCLNNRRISHGFQESIVQTTVSFASTIGKQCRCSLIFSDLFVVAYSITFSNRALAAQQVFVPRCRRARQFQMVWGV